MKATAIAHANIAFIKYWGKKDELLRLPENGSISMNLDSLLTTTTVEFDEKYSDDQILINGMVQDAKSAAAGRVATHLDRVRKLAGMKTKARMASNNNFPAAAGMASSASGFAALTMAAVSATGLKISEKELSIMARLGSGSACRSIPAGFVEWFAGGASDDSYAISLFGPDHWDILDVVAVVSADEKKTLSTAGQKLARTSPFFETRLANLGNKIEKLKHHLAAKDFDAFGTIVEAEALELGAIMLTSAPPLIYWTPPTLSVIKFVKELRENGLPVYFTLDAGANPHLLVESQNLGALQSELQGLNEIKKTIVNRPGGGAKLSGQHLF